MYPSRELDILVAEQVMNIQVGRYQKPYLKSDLEYRCSYGGQSDSFELPHYSTDMTQAWKVAAKVMEKFPCLSLQIHQLGTAWIAQFRHCDVQYWCETEPHKFFDIPAAICSAAVKAVGGSLGIKK